MEQNLQMTHVRKENDLKPNLQGIMFQPLIFRGLLFARFMGPSWINQSFRFRECSKSSASLEHRGVVGWYGWQLKFPQLIQTTIIQLVHSSQKLIV